MTERYHRGNLRPAPADFTTVAPTMTGHDLSLHYGANHRTIKRWVEQTGVQAGTGRIQKQRPLRPVPTDFAQLAVVKSNEALRAHYTAGYDVILRWRAETGVQFKRSNNRKPRPVPADFAHHGPRMTFAQLSAHYGAAEKVIRRWYQESGVERKRLDGVLARARQQIRAPLATGDFSFEGQCAQFLRMFFANVFRCDLLIEGNRRWGDALKLPDRGRWHWNVGGNILDRKQLVALAESKGFGEWREAA